MLDEIFGARQLFGFSSETLPSGTKVGVTATTLDETLCLFTNYNGVGDRNTDLGRALPDPISSYSSKSVLTSS